MIQDYFHLRPSGKRSCQITLPMDWVKKNNLETGDYVRVVEKDNVLHIYPEKRIVEDAK